jgi:hypothetical protein
MSSSSSLVGPFSILPETAYMDIKSRVLNVLMGGLKEDKFNQYRGPTYIPIGLDTNEALLKNYILEYISLNAIKDIHNEGGKQKYTELDDAYLAERQAHINLIFKAYEGRIPPPYSAYIGDFKNGLRSLPDHKEVYDKIKKNLTDLNQWEFSKFLSEVAKKRKGGARRKTKYRLRKIKKRARKTHRKSTH